MDTTLSSVHIWAIAGTIMVIFDILSGTFVMFFFGIGALMTAFLVWTGIISSANSQFFCFSIISVITMVSFRRTSMKMFGGRIRNGYSEFIGQKAVVSVPIPAGGEGRVAYRGSEWIAFSDEKAEVALDSAVVIDAVDGIKLKVRVPKS